MTITSSLRFLYNFGDLAFCVSVGSNSNWKFPIQLIAYESYVFLSLGDL